MRNWNFWRGLAALCFSAGAATAAPPGGKDADWPCAQPRTPTISAAAIWAGPDIAKAGAWDDDTEAAELAQKLASRRTPLDQVDGLLDDFAAKIGADKAGADKDVRLTRVFVGMLELINTERDRVMSGIVRYAQGQNRLAERVRKDSDAVADALQPDDQGGAAKPTNAKPEGAEPAEAKPEEVTSGVANSAEAAPAGTATDVETRLKWDKRIFEERSRSLTYVCETPTLLEQRAFDIARRIQQKL